MRLASDMPGFLAGMYLILYIWIRQFMPTTELILDSGINATTNNASISILRYHCCMEQLLIRNLPEGTKAALRARAARHHHSVEAEARAILTAGLSGEDIPMSVLLAADTGQEIDFEPERLSLTARTPDL